MKKLPLLLLLLTLFVLGTFALSSCDDVGAELSALTAQLGLPDVRVECEHSFLEVAVVKEATCTESGERTLRCARCGFEKNEEIPLLEHTFFEDYSVDLAPTCLTDGKKSIRCSVCQMEKEGSSVVLIKLEHDFSILYKRVDATCTAEGKNVYLCTNCQAIKTEPIAKTEHVYDREVPTNAYLLTAATCTSRAEYVKSCVCGKAGTETFQNGDVLAHIYDREVISDTTLCSAATCRAKAQYAYSCVCGAIGTETFESGEKLPHAFGDWTLALPATCTEKGGERRDCSACDAYELQEVNALGHDFADTWTIDAPADCLTVGSKSHHCQRTGCTEKDSVTEIAALGHVWQWEVDTAATKIAAGKKHEECTRCRAKQNENTEIPVLVCDHTNKAETLAVSPTCLVAGKRGYFYCPDCEKYFEDSTCQLIITDAIADFGIVSPLGHAFTVYTSNGDATCTADGTKTATCDRTNCTETDTKTDVGSMLSHTYDQEVVGADYLKSAATCTEKAIYYKSCVCGAKGDDTFESGEKLAHTYNQEIATETYFKSAATCTAKAVYYKSCVCGDKGTDTFENGEMLAHTYNQEVATATYLKSAATCTAKAVYYKSCVCGAKGTDTFENGDMLAHTYNQEVVSADYLKSAATCTAKAVYYKSCVCGDKGTDTFEVGSTLDHLFTSYVANNDATCTENGTETANCDRDNCDATDTKTVADSALGHSYEKHKATDLSQLFAYRTATEWQNCDGLTLSSTVTACKWLANGGQAGDITNDEAALLIAGTQTNAVSKTAAKRGVTLTKTSDFYVLTASFKAVYNAGNCVNGVKLKVTNGKDQYCLLFVSRDGGNVNSIENTSGASTALGTLPADTWLDVVIVMDVVNQKVVYYVNGVKTAEITTVVPDGLDEVSVYVDKAGKNGKLFLGNFALYQGDANHLSLASVLAATNASASTVPTLTSDDEYTVDEPATCTTAGSKSIHCCRCTATKDSAVIPAFGHTEQWYTDAVATIFADGSRTKTCLTCQTKLSEETLPKLSPSNVYSSMKSDTKDLTVFDENTASFTTLGIEGGAAEFGEKDFFFEFSYLYNDTAATNKLGEPNMQLYLYTTETTLPIANMNIKTGKIYFKNIEEDLKEGMSAPSVYFAYGWHRFGIQIRQEATIVAGAVKYATKYRLYVDGVLANAAGTWSYAKEDVNTKLLFFKATVNENDPTALDYAAPTNALSIKLTLANFYSASASKTVIIPMDAYELTAKKLDRSVDAYAYADLFSMNVVCLDSTGQNANTPVYDLGDGGTFPTQTILATAKIDGATVNGYEYNLPDVTYYRVVGGALAKAPIPVREGYTFAGWSAGNVASGKITFKAQWTPND